MTHRSRSGGPTRSRGKKTATHQRKLHHPPPPTTDSTASTSATASSGPSSSSLPLPPQATSLNPPDSEILALIHRALHSTLSDESFNPTIQRIKGLLFDKAWLEVFCGTESVLEAYAGRWVPSRACCFRELIGSLMNELGEGVFDILDLEGGEQVRQVVERLGKVGLDSVEEDDEEEEGEDSPHRPDRSEGSESLSRKDERPDPTPSSTSQNETTSPEPASASASTPTPTPGPTHILSLGGGAGSELLSISALIRSSLLARPHPRAVSDSQNGKGKGRRWTWTGVDIGDWHRVLDKLGEAVRLDWGIDKDLLEIEYIKGDLVASPQAISQTQSQSQPSDTRTNSNPEEDQSTTAIPVPVPPVDLVPLLQAKPPRLITLLFTLIELLTQSRPATLSLLSTITAHTSPGTLFLIADSASDISQVSLGAGGRTYPIWMIVDLLLSSSSSNQSPNGGGGGWERVRGEESRWFRFAEGVGAGWPCKLENTRYWYRLYRRL